jgi:hypothetical protein
MFSGALQSNRITPNPFLDFLGLSAFTEAAWFKALAIGLLASVTAQFLRENKTRLLWLSALAAAAALAMIFVDSSVGVQKAIDLVPARKVSRITDNDGNTHELPFAITLKSFSRSKADLPPKLVLSDRKSRVLSERFLTDFREISLPQGSKLIPRPERKPSSLRLEIGVKSGEYTNPCVLVTETRADGTEVSRYVLYGFESLVNCAYLEGARLPIHFRYYGDKADGPELLRSNLPWLPWVLLTVGGHSYSIPASKGRRTDIPNSHYSVTVAKSNPGDYVSGEPGEVELVVSGPRGEDRLRVGEKAPTAYGTTYSGLSARYVHPRANGESSSFVRIIAGDGISPSVAVFRNGISETVETLGPGTRLTLGETTITLSGVVPDPEISENLLQAEKGTYAFSFQLAGEDEESRKDIVISPSQYYPVQLAREQVSLGLRPHSGATLGSAFFEVAVQNQPTRSVEVTPSEPLKLGAWTVSIVGVDPLQGSYLVVGFSSRLFGGLPIVLLAISVLIFGLRVAFFVLVSQLFIMRSRE